MLSDGLMLRFLLCVTVATVTGAAMWVNPADQSPPPTVLHGPRSEATPPKASAAPQASSQAPVGSEITVVRWEFSPTTPLQPVYLSMTLYGMQAAIDRMQNGSPLTVQVRWVHDNAKLAPGDSDIVTDLTIGGPDLAAALDGDVRRNGYFEWHTWARKDYLTPGPWTVSVTYPDGRPLPCGPDAQPCRFTIYVG